MCYGITMAVRACGVGRVSEGVAWGVPGGREGIRDEASSAMAGLGVTRWAARGVGGGKCDVRIFFSGEEGGVVIRDTYAMYSAVQSVRGSKEARSAIVSFPIPAGWI